MKRKRILLGMLSMGYGKLVSAAIQLAMVPALAHAWGLQLYGQWIMLSSIPVFLGASDFGFGSAAGYRLIGEVARGETDEALRTFQSAQAVILASSAVMLFVACLVSFVLPDRMLAVEGAMSGADARTVLLILCIFGVVALQSSLFMAVMRSAGHFARSTSFDATVQLAEGAAVIAIALAGGKPVHAALAYLAVRCLGVMGHIWLAMRHAAWLRLGFASALRERARLLLRPALAAMMLPISQAGYVQGTALAVGAAAGPAAVPIFTSLRTLSRVGLQLLMTLNLPILPEFAAEYARGNREWLQRVTGGMVTLNLVVGLVSALGLGFLGEWVLAIWTKGVIDPPLSMIWLTAAALAAGTLWNPLSNLLVSINRHEGFTYFFAMAAAGSVGLTYWLVVVWGITGAAVANLLLDVAMLVSVTGLLRRAIGGFAIGTAAVRQFVGAR